MTGPNSIAEKLAQPLRVRTSKTQFVLFVLLALFFVPMSLWNFYRSLISGFAIVPTVISLMIFVGFGSFAVLFFRGMRRLPRLFHREGVTRTDGKKFPWSELKLVEHQYHNSKYSPSQKAVWRIEVRFDKGKVWLLPLKIVNFAEIYQFVSSLPCEHTEKNYGRG